jgi:PPOX class probable F420-dependent enzyme
MIETRRTTLRKNEMLAEFEGKKYLQLETYRRNGQPVRTTVWFVADNPLLYVRTNSKSGKAKRIRKNPHVRLVPVKPTGKPDGEWIDGEALIAKEPSLKRINRMMDAKCGLADKLIAWLYRFFTRREESDTIISIRV